MPELPTYASLSSVLISSLFMPKDSRYLSSKSSPQLSGRLSANTPNNPLKTSREEFGGIKTSSLRGNENGLIGNPCRTQPISY